MLLLAATNAAAADVALIGVIGDKAAVLAIDGGEPKTVKVGQTWKGISVVSVQQERATVEIGGKKRVLQRGQHYRAGATATTRQSTTLSADPRGHFISDGAVNGVQVRFLVDTGATAIALPAAEASRLGIDYLKGERSLAGTAAGTVTAWRVQLDTVRIGDIEINAVEAIVIEKGLEIALLGMTFLNRVEMRRDGQTMVLIRRF